VSGPLDGQVALVTGAGGGIGRALAKSLAAEGAAVWLAGRTEATLAQTARTCGESAEVRVADLTVDAELAALVDDLADRHGRLDIFAHAAGTIAHGTVEESPVEALDTQYRSNVRMFYAAAQRLLPLLRTAHGQVVVVNSSIVNASRPGTGQFASTQQALRAITDSLRHEVNDDGIRVLSVYPGRTATSRQERLYEREGREYRPELLLQPEDVATVVVNALALARTAEVTDVHVRPMQKSY
jgi:NADP-dependent 3-hydroxy acid dehydrogenase YdfG